MTGDPPTPEQRAPAPQQARPAPQQARPAPQRARPATLTPHVVLGWLRSLSIDLAAAAILDANGALLAGDAELARVHLEHAAEAPDPRLIIARSDRHAVVVRTAPTALQRLARADVQAALEALEGR